ncbi:hypothetical protein BH24DEI1_BH24DEI1_00760 [soil metagenome]
MRDADSAPDPTDDQADTISPDTISLGDALKLAGLAATGGQAKLLIQSGQVRVNGVVETRRKRKLSPGDVIETGGESFELELSDKP